MCTRVFSNKTFVALFLAAMHTIAGTVTKVSDGDTIHLVTPEQTKLHAHLIHNSLDSRMSLVTPRGHENRLIDMTTYLTLFS